MSNIIRLTDSQLTDMAEKLEYYDVVQHGWEQEPNGFEANAHHVLTHLTKDLMNKTYMQEHQSRTEVAPDILQYALRLRRWAGIAPDERSKEWIDSRTKTREIMQDTGVSFTPTAIILEANGMLAAHLHGLDHAKDRPGALESRHQDIGRASGLLICSAEMQAEMFNFDLQQAFDDRLYALRTRFKIPQPA